ncbi:MAG TPA: cupin domain-containing protein [Pyrinomonadaceae bacterium]|jgi:ribosomal protein L16 Arg81 hydroxylase
MTKAPKRTAARGRALTLKTRRGAGAGAIARILEPLGVDEFLSSYFERRPLVVRGTPEKFAHVFTPDQFKFGLDRVTEIRAVFPGLWQATIHPGDIKEMVNAGASICVTGLEEAHPRLLKLAEAIKKELGYAGTVSFRAYFSPPNAGFDLHYDARVATTLQIAGSKRWWFSDEPAAAFPERNSPRQLKILKREHNAPEPERMRSVLLRPGDLLCLPAGAWHRARAKNASLSLNLAFDHHGAGVFDVIVNALGRKLRSDPAWRAPLPTTPGAGDGTLPPAVAAILRERVDAMRSALLEMRDSDAALARAWAGSLSPDFP